MIKIVLPSWLVFLGVLYLIGIPFEFAIWGALIMACLLSLNVPRNK